MKTINSVREFERECRRISRELKAKYSEQEIDKRIQYCDQNWTKICCEECRYYAECKKINDEIPKMVVNGKRCGTYFLQDINAYLGI